MATHIKDLQELIDIVKEAKKVLNNLFIDTTMSLNRVQGLLLRIDKILEEIK